MAYPTIIYNATTGSDTAASGAGPATAVTGTAAAHTGGVASTTITLTNTPDLSGVATDGSAAIWLNDTAGNRHLSKITAVNDGADTVTVEDSFNIASGSPVDYAIGGKRKTTENDTSNVDTADGKAGWTFEYEAGTYTATVTNSVSGGNTTDGPITIRAATGASPLFNASSAPHNFTVTGGVVMRGLTIKSSGFRYAVLVQTAEATIFMEDCEIDVDTASAVGLRISNSTELVARNCYFHGASTGSSAVQSSNGRYHLVFEGCSFMDIGSTCLSIGTSNVYSMVTLTDCIIHNTTGVGLSISDSGVYNVIVNRCTIDGSTSHGIESLDTTINQLLSVTNSVITNNGGYGIKAEANGNSHAFSDYNAFRANTSGNYNNVAAGANDVVLTADPFTAIGSDNFSLNNTAGGGAACRNAGFPGAFLDGLNTGYSDLGALRHQDPAGGGGGGPIVVGCA